MNRIFKMRAKIKAGGHASPYRLRKQLPEPTRSGGLDNLNRPEIACAVEAIEIEENLALASLGSGIL
jgi:hypothetical protein